MKLVITTRNEVNEVGVRELAREFGVLSKEDLKEALNKKFQDIYDQLVKANPDLSRFSNLSWEFSYE